MQKNKKIIIGSEEWISLPILNIPLIKARIDSGAKTSTIHAENISKFTRNGERWVSFDVLPLQKSRKSIRCEARILDRRIVKSSTGEREERYVIETTLEIGSQAWQIEINLTNRDSMGYRMLLGRQAMVGRLMVDPAEHFCLGDNDVDIVSSFYKSKLTNKRGLKIGILASNPNLYSNKRIVEACEERGHEPIFLNIQQCYMKLDSKKPEVHNRGGKIINDLDAVIPRIKPSITFYGCALVRQFESMGVYCLNGADAISHSRDKLYSLQKLLSYGLQIPITGFANSPLDTNDVIDMVGGSPLIVKLLEGTQGRGVVLAETKKASESVVNAFKSLKANILVQEFIKEAKGVDLRCFIVDGKVVSSIQRVAAAGDFRANLHRGAKASIIKITAEERNIAVKAAKAFNLRVAGVDIIRSQKGPLILEVNSSPGLEGVENASGKDIAGAMVSAIERKIASHALRKDK